jgi:protease-4
MKKFLINVLASAAGGLLLFFGAITFFGALSEVETVKDRPESFILVIDASVVSSEAGASPSFASILNNTYEASIPFRKILAAIDSASQDQSVAALLLDEIPVFHGRAAKHEFHKALMKFKEKSEKKIYAYSERIDLSNYHILSACDEIYAAPLENFYMLGDSVTVSFYAKALQNIGIEVQTTRVGKYKSGIEPYLLEEASLENATQISELMFDFQEVAFQDIASTRRMSVEDLNSSTSDLGIISLKEAKDLGYIDDIFYRDQLIDYMSSLVPCKKEVDNFAQVHFNTYISSLDEELVLDAPVVVVYAEGEIVDGHASDGIAGDTFSELLRDLRLSHDSLKALVLRVDSPGGSAFASEQILREINLIKDKGVKIIVSMANVAASGGYWIASSSDQIFVQPNTVTGSIGVYGLLPNYEKFAEKVGINNQTFTLGGYRDIFSLAHSKNPEELLLVQKSVDQIYESFLERVSFGRNLSLEHVEEIAQGRVWSGKEALDLGLVDKIGGLNDAVEYALKVIDMPGGGVEYLEPVLDEFEQLLVEFANNDSAPIVVLPKWLPLKSFSLPSSFSSGVIARLPFSIR